MIAVPAAARTACWLNAWLRQRESTDAVISGLLGGRSAVRFHALGALAPLPPALFLGELRSRAVTRVSVALPLAGDPIGLGGPATFNADAQDAGEAVLLHDIGLGLVPHHLGAETRWVTGIAAPPSYLPDIATADLSLRAVLLDVTEELVALDIGSWNPDVADALMNLRAPMQLDPPLPFASTRALATAVSALRCIEIVKLALRDDGGAVTASEITSRRRAMAPLLRAAHAAVVAACSSVDGR